MLDTLYIALTVAALFFCIFIIYLLILIRKTSSLIEETKDNLKEQSEELKETFDKIDEAVEKIDIFVHTINSSVDEFKSMQTTVSNIVVKAEKTATNVLTSINNFSELIDNSYHKIEKPVTETVDLIGNIGTYIQKIKAFLPSNKKDKDRNLN
ncbi:MAG: hypothetical protein ABFD00_02845 [Chloroherpetonaceae bacterium]